MELDMKALGRNIRYYRKRKGWKQRQLAEIIDVTDEYISHVENAHVRPSLDKAVAIANALGIDMNTLLEDSLSGARREILNQRQRAHRGHGAGQAGAGRRFLPYPGKLRNRKAAEG